MFFLVSSRYRFLLGWSAKNACTTIKLWYSELHGLDLEPRSVHEAIGYGDTDFTRVRDSPLPLGEYRKILLIRNPYDRLISGFLDKYVVYRQYPNLGWSTFAEFVDVLCARDPFGERTKPPGRINKHHFVPQTGEDFYLARRMGWNWDLVMAVETFTADLQRLNRLVGVSAADPGVIHKTPVADRGPCSTDAALIPIDALAPPFPAYRCFYAGRRLRSKVRKFYRDDFEYFSSLGFEYVI